MKDIHKPNKRFGQHFLKDGCIADRIIDFAGIQPDDAVLEIGPGIGILTERLVETAGTIAAVEIDHNLFCILNKRFGKDNKIRIIEEDILKVDLREIFRGVPKRIKVVSNIPYNISTPIIDFLSRNRVIVSEAVLMLQKEVAQRLLSEPGSKNFGLTTLNLALCARGSKLMDVKPSAFNPQPEVMSSVIKLIFSERLLYNLENEDIFHRITGVAFRQRRKMVRNTLIPYMVSQGISKSDAYDIFSSAGIDPVSRPEILGVGEFVQLSNMIYKTRLVR